MTEFWVDGTYTDSGRRGGGTATGQYAGMLVLADCHGSAAAWAAREYREGHGCKHGTVPTVFVNVVRYGGIGEVRSFTF